MPPPPDLLEVNEICMTRQRFLLGAHKERLRQRIVRAIHGKFTAGRGLGSPFAAPIHPAGIFCWRNTIGPGQLPSGRTMSDQQGSALGFQALFGRCRMAKPGSGWGPCVGMGGREREATGGRVPKLPGGERTDVTAAPGRRCEAFSPSSVHRMQTTRWSGSGGTAAAGRSIPTWTWW